jgi:hypothetical protein
MNASAWLIFRSNWLVLADTQLHPLARAWMIGLRHKERHKSLFATHLVGESPPYPLHCFGSARHLPTQNPVERSAVFIF